MVKLPEQLTQMSTWLLHDPSRYQTLYKIQENGCLGLEPHLILLPANSVAVATTIDRPTCATTTQISDLATTRARPTHTHSPIVEVGYTQSEQKANEDRDIQQR